MTNYKQRSMKQRKIIEQVITERTNEANKQKDNNNG